MKSQHIVDVATELEPKWLRRAAAARYVGLSVRTIDDLKSKGDLPHYAHGSSVLFKVEDLETYMERQRVDVR